MRQMWREADASDFQTLLRWDVNCENVDRDLHIFLTIADPENT